MRGNQNRSSYGWLIGAGICAALLGVFGSLGAALLLGGLIFGGIVLLVAIVVIIALKGSADDTRSRAASGSVPLEPEDAAILRQARRDLTDLRMINTHLTDPAVRILCSESCNTVERIISTVKEQPEEIRKAQLYFQYYLQTERDLMKKYAQLEKNGQVTPEIREKIMKYLLQIKTTSDTQLTGLFEDDIADINAELELLQHDLEMGGLN